MKKTQLSLVIIALFMTFSQVYSQSLINPLSIPKKDKNMPEWAELMYQEPINIFKVKEAYDVYYGKDNDHEKNGKVNKEEYDEKATNRELEEKYIEYYFRLITTYKPFINSEGIIDTQKATQNVGQKAKSHTNGSVNKSIWNPMNAETYVPINDDVAQPMIDEIANIYTFDVFKANTSILYAAAESGGFFKTIDNGLNWTQIGMNMNFGGIDAVAIHPTNSDIVLVGNNNYIYRSTDGGENWTSVLNVSNLGVNMLEVSSLDPNLVLAATNKGVYRSSDAGANFTNIVTSGATDIKIAPSDVNTVYTVLKNTSINFYECWKSTNAGQSFTVMNNGWSTNYTGGEALIGLTAADPNTVYIAQLTSTVPILHKSTNAGSSWSIVAIGETTDFEMNNGQGFYDFVIIVSPLDANELMVGTQSLYKSYDGGSTFECKAGYCGGNVRIHVDYQFARAIGGQCWISSDGGITYSTDFYTSESISRINGLNAGSWWGYAQGWNTDIFVGGLYHNGDLAYNENCQNKTMRMGGGESPTGYVNPMFNEEMYCSDIGGWRIPAAFDTPYESIPDITKYPNESYWDVESSELEWDPRCPKTFYIGNDNDFLKTIDGGINYTTLFSATNPGAKIMQIEVSRKNPDYMYLVEMNSSTAIIWKTTDGGQTWTETNPIPSVGNSEQRYKAITMSESNENELWVALKDGSAFHKVYKTTDGGSNWTNLTTSTIGSMQILSIVHQMGTDGGVYIGGYNGKVYYRNNTQSDWQSYLSGLPANGYATFLRPFYRDNKIRLAGNGVWEAPLFEPSLPSAQPMVDKLIAYNCPAPIDTFYFEDYSVLSVSGATWQWSFPGASYVSSTTVRNPKVVYDTEGSYSVTLTVSNGANSDTKTITDMVSVSGPTINAVPVSQDFSLTQFPPQDWSSKNVGNGYNWERTTDSGATGSSESMLYDNYYNDAEGAKDHLQTANYDFSALTDAQLTFDVAYTPYDAGNYSDSLSVLISTDCGVTYTEVYSKGGSTLATFPTAITDSAFIPLSDQWRTETINLNTYIGEPKVMVIFESRGHYGQRLYVDNINITTTTKLNELSKNSAVFAVYPNPNNGQFTVKLNLEEGKKYNLEITNLLGQTIRSEKIDEKLYTKTFNLRDKGVFIVSLTDEQNIRRTQKIIVE